MINGADPFDFAALTVAHNEANAFDAVVPPIVQTSLFTFCSYDEMVAAYRSDSLRVRDLREKGIEVMILSSEPNTVVAARAKKMGGEAVQGVGIQDKGRVL